MPMRHSHADHPSSHARSAAYAERCYVSGPRGRCAMTTEPLILSRRTVLAGTGALFVNFSLFSAKAQQQQKAEDAQNAGRIPNAAPLPGSLKDNPFLDSWIKIDAQGQVTVITGKAELGQGIKTA